MSFLRNLMGRVANNFGSTEPEAQEDRPCAVIPLVRILRTFQLFQDHLYTVGKDIPSDADDVKLLGSIYEEIKSPAQDHFRNPKNIRITDMCARQREDGSFMTYVEYWHNQEGAGEIQWVSLLIARALQDDDGITFDPQFCLTGYTADGDGDHGLLVVPQEVLCRALDQDEPVFAQPENDEELIGAIAYANQAFLQFLAGEEITPRQNQQLLSPANLEAASQIVLYLNKRNSRSLSEDITRYQADQKLGLALPDRHI